MPKFSFYSRLSISLFLFLFSPLFSENFEDEKKYEESAQIWQDLLKKEPENPEYLYELGKLYSWMHEYEKAEALLTKSLQINPKNADTKLSLAYVYLWTNREKKAKKLFLEILKEYPDYKDARVGLKKANEQIAKSKIQEETQGKATLESLQELLEIDPDNSLYLYQMGRLYLRKKEYKKAEYFLNKSLSFDPDNADVKLSLAYVYAWTNREKKAQALFLEILEQYPNYKEAQKGLDRVEMLMAQKEEKASDEESLEEALSLYELGKEYAEKKEYSKAEELLTKSLQLNPENADTKLSLAYVYLWMKREEKAKELFLEILKEYPNYKDAKTGLEKIDEKDNALSLYELGKEYAEKKEYSKAEELLTKSLQLNPENADTKLSLAYVYLWTEREEKAKELFLEILKGYPDYADAKAGLEKIEELLSEKKPSKEKLENWQQDYIKLAECYEKRKEYGKAVITWSYLLDNSPKQKALFSFRLGQVFSWMEKWHLATAYLRHSLNLEPENGDAKLRLAYVYLFSSRLLCARNLFCQLIKKDQKNTDAIEGFARTEEALRLNCSAKAAYLRRFSLAPPTYNLFRGCHRVLKWTRPWLKLNGIYGQERETDLITKVRSAQRNVALETNDLFIPLSERSRAILFAGGGIEREINLINGENNFAVAIAKYGCGFDWQMHPFWTLFTRLEIKEGWQYTNSLFPMNKERRVEPQATLTFLRQNFTTFFTAARDSFLVKDFSNQTTSLLLRDTYLAQSEIQFYNYTAQAGLLGFIREYHDSIHNVQREGSGWCAIGYPCYTPCFFLQYLGRIGGFRETETDYYSYSRQWEHFAKIFYRNRYVANSDLEFGYLHSWQWSRNLNQPVSTAVFVERLFRNTNRLYVELDHLYRPNIRGVLRSEYYWDSTQYTAWIVRGELNLIF